MLQDMYLSFDWSYVKRYYLNFYSGYITIHACSQCQVGYSMDDGGSGSECKIDAKELV